MYKKQLSIQKFICLLCVIAAAVTFVYALGIMTDIYDALSSAINLDYNEVYVEGAMLYYDMQGFNKWFVEMSIVAILIACVLFLTNTHTRRRYYIGNYVSIALYSGFSIYLNLEANRQISFFKNQFLTTVDFEGLKAHSEMYKTLYLGPEDTFFFDLHYVTAGLTVLAVVLLIANMIWKILLMNSEKKLIQAGKEAA